MLIHSGQKISQVFLEIWVLQIGSQRRNDFTTNAVLKKGNTSPTVIDTDSWIIFQAFLVRTSSRQRCLKHHFSGENLHV
jgi:hypothetical protein